MMPTYAKDECYSLNEERWGDDLNEMLEEYFDDFGEMPESMEIYVGTQQDHKASEFAPSGESVIDTMIDHACDNGPECASDWLDKIAPEHIKALDTMLKTIIDAWAENHGMQPRFWTAEKTRRETIKTADVLGEERYREMVNEAEAGKRG